MSQEQWHQAEQVLQGGLARAQGDQEGHTDLLCALVELHAVRLQWQDVKDALAEHRQAAAAEGSSPAGRTLDCLAHMTALATV